MRRAGSVGTGPSSGAIVAGRSQWLLSSGKSKGTLRPISAIRRHALVPGSGPPHPHGPHSDGDPCEEGRDIEATRVYGVSLLKR